MPYQNLQDGLYLVSQPAEKDGVSITHYGILDIGNVLRHPAADGSHPVVVHQTPPRIRADWLANTGNWNVLGRVSDIAGAMERLKQAFADPEYDMIGNNCEHFARRIADGESRSHQIFWAGAGAFAVGALVLQLFRGAR